MKHNYLKLIWNYPNYTPYGKSVIDGYFEQCKDKGTYGDEFSNFAAFVIDIICYRKKQMTISEMEDLLDSYDFPKEYSDRLTHELQNIM